MSITATAARAASLPSRRPGAVILACTVLWALCYPPFPLGILGFAVLAPAMLATIALAPRQAFGAWFRAGVAGNALMYWWIWHVVKVGPPLLVGAGVALLIAFLSLFNGLAGYALSVALLAPRGRRRLLLALFPAAFAGLEVLRAMGELSFPWGNLAYTLGDWPVLFQSVSLWGVYGLTAAMVASNLLLAGALRGGPPARLRYAGFAAIPLALLLHGIASLHAGGDANTPRITVALVQPSVPQVRKWDEAYFQEVMGKTFRTLEGPGHDLAPVRGADLVVLPETAVPDFIGTRDEVADSLRAVAGRAEAHLVAGALDYEPHRTRWSDYRFFNSAFLFVPGDSGGPERYSKQRLVPFSEKLPFNGLFPALNYVERLVGSSGFSPGDGHRVFTTAGIPWAPSICYEVIYPSFVREARNQGARLLVNITNDGWFGRSNGPYQHANIARFRAAESGMPVARAANNGISAVFDAHGRDLGRTALMDSLVLRREVPVPDRKTAYARAGAWLDAAWAAALLVWVALAAWPRPRGGATLRS